MSDTTAKQLKPTGFGKWLLYSLRCLKRGKVNESNGRVIWHGKSRLDSAPIVVIAVLESSNDKTGRMIQTYILRSDINPWAAVLKGLDASVCGGDCPHRGDGHGNERSCYVLVWQGAGVVFKTYEHGGYPDISNFPSRVRSLGLARAVRLGAYGDPGAVPLAVWERLLFHASGWTGYTHRWRTCPELKPYCMASVDSVADQKEAERAGWRTFRGRGKDDPILEGEITCPASKEAGHLTTCEHCLLCDGTNKVAKNITTIVHGPGAKWFYA